MGQVLTYLIPLAVVLVVGLLAGRRILLSTFLKELGEAIVETSIYIKIDNPTQEDTDRFKKEWLEAIQAGGGLFEKVLKKALAVRFQRGQGMRK